MNRFTKLGISTMAAASVASGAFALASTGAASAATRAPAAHASACGVSARNYPLPKAPTAFRAGSAGSVAVATVNAGTIRVAGIHPAPG